MKSILLCSFILLSTIAFSQSLQLHYDMRHTLDPKLNSENYSTLYFEYFKIIDSGKRFIKPGAFLFKSQADFTGERSNLGQIYVQTFQQFRFWQPKIFISLQYSGGLGVTTPREYSYYIVNAYSLGLAYPFKLGSAFVSSGIDYKYSAFRKRSCDLSYSFYYYQGLFNYKAEISGDLSLFTQNRNHGDDLTKNLHGKIFLFFAEPQYWFKVRSNVSIGTKINCYFHIITSNNSFQAYPTAAIRLKL